jgi:hypothetical protein
MRDVIVYIDENWIISEHPSVHRSECFEYSHLEYYMMSWIHILRASIGNEFFSISIEGSTLIPFDTHFVDYIERI